MKTIKVRATVVVEVQLSDDSDEHFIIEENSCPGTGVVGSAITAAIAHGDETSTCWACALSGENHIIEIIA